MRRIVLRLGVVLLVGFVAIQLVPYGRDHSNPSGGVEPAWDSERTRELAVGACYDCHSNDTEWPWYSNVAPMSWLVMRDVENGRDAFNFQDPEDVDDDGDEAAEVVEEGSMPPSQYKLMHPDARLSASEKEELIQGLEATFGGGEDNSGPGKGGGDGNDDNSGPGGGGTSGPSRSSREPPARSKPQQSPRDRRESLPKPTLAW